MKYALPNPRRIQPRPRPGTYQPPQQVPHPTLLVIRFSECAELEQHLHDNGHWYSLYHGRFVRK